MQLSETHTRRQNTHSFEPLSLKKKTKQNPVSVPPLARTDFHE